MKLSTSEWLDRMFELLAEREKAVRNLENVQSGIKELLTNRPVDSVETKEWLDSHSWMGK